MKNWSQQLSWSPAELAYPESEEAIVLLVQRAVENGRKVRVIGSGHSFTPLVPTDDVLVSLDTFQGLVSVDRNALRAAVRGGTKLYALGELLFAAGMAMENMGDIDAQSIAGTISTGTHGTGVDFGTISTQVVGLRFVNGKGEVVSCSPKDKPELFRCMQVSLGALGIITEVTLQCVPAYRLALENRKEPLEAVLADLENRKQQNRNFEFYWMPYTGTAWTKSSNAVSGEQPDQDNWLNKASEYLLENVAFKVLCDLAHTVPAMNKPVARISAASVPTLRKVYHSHRVYATKRLVRFMEMEYNVPAEAYADVFKEIRQRVNTGGFNVHFPIENRWVKADQIPLSPAHGRDSAYIACHVYHKKPFRPYFEALESIFRAHGGRPHWGKWNSLKAADVAELYPEFPLFLRHREQHDPDGVFRTPYLEKLLGA